MKLLNLTLKVPDELDTSFVMQDECTYDNAVSVVVLRKKLSYAEIDKLQKDVYEQFGDSLLIFNADLRGYHLVKLHDWEDEDEDNEPA